MAPRNLEWEESETPRGHLLDAINLGMKTSASCGGKNEPSEEVVHVEPQKTCPRVWHNATGPQGSRTFHAALEKKSCAQKQPIVCSRDEMRIMLKLKRDKRAEAFWTRSSLIVMSELNDALVFIDHERKHTAGL